MPKFLKARAVDCLNMFIGRWGKVIVPRESLYEWQLKPILEPVFNPSSLSDDAQRYLVPDNPKLVDLKRRYAKCDPNVTTPLVWTEGYVRTEDIAYFRGDNAYVWQLRDNNSNVIGYTLATYYVKSIDDHKLLDKLTEDNDFGNFTFKIAGRVISRDLLDSIIEVNFLDRHLGLMSRRDIIVLDIGAGYGRLAHRASTSVLGLSEYLCVDAVPYSTFISEFYLRYRNTDKVQVIALDQFEQTLTTKKIDIAVNIHSFSECRLEAIEWWVSRLARAKVNHLLIAPNALGSNGELLQTNDRKDFLPLLEKYGYRLLVREPKYRDPLVQKYAISPTHYFLFKLV